MTQPAPKKTPVKKTTKKRQLNKLPVNLALYNYEAFSYKDMQRAVTYFQAELAKIEKLLSKLPMVTQETRTNSPVGNPYMDIYGGQPTNQMYKGNNPNQLVKQQSIPEVVAPPLPYQPYTSGLLGDHMEMPGILSSGGVVKSSEAVSNGYQTMPPTPFNTPVETAKLPIVEDNSEQLGAELGALLNQ